MRSLNLTFQGPLLGENSLVSISMEFSVFLAEHLTESIKEFLTTFPDDTGTSTTFLGLVMGKICFS